MDQPTGQTPDHPNYSTADPNIQKAISENAQAPILQEILTGAEEFLTGSPVHIAIDIPSEQLKFTAKNPFGVTYDFTFGENNGKVVLKGTPQ